MIFLFVNFIFYSVLNRGYEQNFHEMDSAYLNIHILKMAQRNVKKVLMNFVQKMDVLVWILTTWVQFKCRWRTFSMREGSVIVCTNFEWI